MRILKCPIAVGLAAVLLVAPVAGAFASDRFGHGPGWNHRYPHGGSGSAFGRYDRGYGFAYGGGYGFADAAVSGDYIGAPLTRFPRPSEIVPPAWGYGTYGVPTATGIRQAPTAPPSLTVIDSPAPVALRRGGVRSRVLSRDGEGRWSNVPAAVGPTGDGVHVVSVTVPRR